MNAECMEMAKTFTAQVDIKSIAFSEISRGMSDWFCPEFQHFRSPIIVRDLMKELVERLDENDETATEILSGASGVGKTSTLLAVGHLARKGGAIVLPFSARALQPNSVMKVIKTWAKHAGDFLQRRCECNNQQTFASLIETLNEDNGLQVLAALIRNLQMVKEVPVVIIVDAANALYQDDKPTSPQNPVATVLGNIFQFSVCRGLALFSLSGSFKAAPFVKDGNACVITQISPMTKSEFTMLMELNNTLKTKRTNFDEIFEICNGLPRELQWVAKSWTADSDFSAAKTIYFNTRKSWYRERIELLLKDEQEGVDIEVIHDLVRRKQRVSFPRSLVNGGLVVTIGAEQKICCQAAEEALSMITAKKGILAVFSGESLKSAEILRRLYKLHPSARMFLLAVLFGLSLRFPMMTVLKWLWRMAHHFTLARAFAAGLILVFFGQIV